MDAILATIAIVDGMQVIRQKYESDRNELIEPDFFHPSQITLGWPPGKRFPVLDQDFPLALIRRRKRGKCLTMVVKFVLEFGVAFFGKIWFS